MIWHTCNYLIYWEKESLYAERNGYYPYCNNAKKIVLRASICIFSSYFLFVDSSLIIYAHVSTFTGFVVQNYRAVGRISYKMNIRPPLPPCNSDLAPDNSWLGKHPVLYPVEHLSKEFKIGAEILKTINSWNEMKILTIVRTTKWQPLRVGLNNNFWL